MAHKTSMLRMRACVQCGASSQLVVSLLISIVVLGVYGFEYKPNCLRDGRHLLKEFDDASAGLYLAIKLLRFWVGIWSKICKDGIAILASSRTR